MRFRFPDVADFPDNFAPRYDPPPTRRLPLFRYRTLFARDLQRLTTIAADQCDTPDEEAILQKQVAAIGAVAARYWALPFSFEKPPGGRHRRVPAANGPLAERGVLLRQADTGRLWRFFREQIRTVGRLEPQHGAIWHSGRNDPEACAFVQGFLTGLDLYREACAYRGTVTVQSVTVRLATPGARPVCPLFRDCQRTTGANGFHVDPQPGALVCVIYLDDVDENCGPLQVVRDSHKWEVDEIERIFAWGNAAGNHCHSPAHRRVANAFPPRFRRSAFAGRLALDGTPLSDLLLRNAVRYTSETANVMLFDPSVTLHRTGTCDAGANLALKVVLK